MEQVLFTKEAVEQWVKEHPIQWEEATADDAYGRKCNIIFERYYVLDGVNLFYVIDEILFEDGNEKYNVVRTDNHRRHKRCEELFVATRNSLEEAKRAAEEDRVDMVCDYLRVK